MKKTFYCVLMATCLMALPSTSWAADRALAFAVSGVVADIKVQPGASVAQGDVLAVLDLAPFQARAQAADAAVKATKVILDLASRRLQQTQELFDALSTSAEQVELAQTTQANAKMAYENARRDAALAAWKLGRATLKAPTAGTVASIPGYVGQVVNLNAETLAVVVVNTP
ncbi:efflux RND transporter periplasmic adaptor subunit [Magnetovibrio blakemorei]|uniref:Multidrug resistance protein MdtA-like barrel-sandwich hybrid domain-containing protein n=1 Tax=Magnetovibrio blakemorei TaxID=28181 RepID=A0A1E5Q9V6_9PROT|nr:biotin/lipoyl-binding protein [Magnetovibrio blakemorei]OEJ68513.1 hypothetical protein BEN30_06195 [Magnetovibrio blakemorei]